MSVSIDNICKFANRMSCILTGLVGRVSSYLFTSLYDLYISKYVKKGDPKLLHNLYLGYWAIITCEKIFTKGASNIIGTNVTGDDISKLRSTYEKTNDDMINNKCGVSSIQSQLFDIIAGSKIGNCTEQAFCSMMVLRDFVPNTFLCKINNIDHVITMMDSSFQQHEKTITVNKYSVMIDLWQKRMAPYRLGERNIYWDHVYSRKIPPNIMMDQSLEPLYVISKCDLRIRQTKSYNFEVDKYLSKTQKKIVEDKYNKYIFLKTKISFTDKYKFFLENHSFSIISILIGSLMTNIIPKTLFNCLLYATIIFYIIYSFFKYDTELSNKYMTDIWYLDDVKHCLKEMDKGECVFPVITK